MQKISPQQERALNIVFGCLLIFSLLLFAGIPAIQDFPKVEASQQSQPLK